MSRVHQTSSNRGVNGGRGAVVRFGRFRVLLRQRQLIADGLPIELGTRAFDLLLVLLEANGSLVTKDELLGRVWPGIVVSEENLKVQISALRKALGADRDVIRTEFGRGYRFTAALRANLPAEGCRYSTRARLRAGRALAPQSCRQWLRVIPVGASDHRAVTEIWQQSRYRPNQSRSTSSLTNAVVDGKVYCRQFCRVSWPALPRFTCSSLRISVRDGTRSSISFPGFAILTPHHGMRWAAYRRAVPVHIYEAAPKPNLVAPPP